MLIVSKLILQLKMITNNINKDSDDIGSSCGGNGGSTNNKKNLKEFVHLEDKILIKHSIGVNSDNYLLKKSNNKKLQFSLFKLNNIFYVNINSEHIIDYRKFTCIQKITTKNNDLIVKNSYIGELIIPNCDIDLIQKSLVIMSDWMKKKKTWYNDIIYWIFN